MNDISTLISANLSETHQQIIDKILNGERLLTEEGLSLYTDMPLSVLGVLANYRREKINGNLVYYNKNFHLEPTNICIYSCKFCSYSRKKGEEGSWEYSTDDMLTLVKDFSKKGVTEVHIVGGVHPHRDVHYYASLLKQIREVNPNLHIKAFTAAEIDFMIKKARMPLSDGFALLKEAGLGSMPGGGAEIFNYELRQKICPEKTGTDRWLEIHRLAHKAGIPSNATMLYGHLESYVHRIEHMEKLRQLQDETSGFNTFIPLKYRMKNNFLGITKETSMMEDLRNFAVARLFLDNIPHLKAYWPMIGRQLAQLSLSFGVDDLDGTIEDSTKIYSMAGADDKNPSLSTADIEQLIRDVNREPVERDTLYNRIKRTS